MDTKETIAIVGAGFMGSTIATLCAAHGHRVALHDTNAGTLESFAKRAIPIARYLAGATRRPEDILSRIESHSSLEQCVGGASFVHEVIQEDLEAKRRLFQTLDRVCPDSVMLATNTSSY